MNHYTYKPSDNHFGHEYINLDILVWPFLRRWEMGGGEEF